MAKGKKVDNAEARLLALEEENKILREQSSRNEKLNVEMNNVLTTGLMDEIKNIRRKGNSSANRLEIREKHDHKNISLWTKYGKRIGPMHPENAVQTLHRFLEIGIALTSTQPTPEQIEAYKQTKEYKDLEQVWKTNRARKDKTRKSGQMEKLTNEIAKMAGQSAETLNRVFNANQVKARG